MNAALKEWAVVIAALAEGAQDILLRKGGIVEGRRGFQLKHERFLLFPTYEHQHRNWVTPDWQPRVDELAADHDPASVQFRYEARVLSVIDAPPAPEQFDSVHARHIFHPDFVRMRYAYRPELPLYLLRVEVKPLPAPVTVPLRPAYAGCKSWVHLTEEVAV